LKPSTVALTFDGTILQEFMYICCFDAWLKFNVAPVKSQK
jgi:hypothetical protein